MKVAACMRCIAYAIPVIHAPIVAYVFILKALHLNVLRLRARARGAVVRVTAPTLLLLRQSAPSRQLIIILRGESSRERAASHAGEQYLAPPAQLRLVALVDRHLRIDPG